MIADFDIYIYISGFQKELKDEETSRCNFDQL